MKRVIKKILITLIVLGLIGGGIYMFMGKKAEGAKVTYNYAKAELTDISTSVTATGTIEPVTKVEVGTQVSGKVSKLYVDYNSQVKAGQVIAELDRSNLNSELNSAKANLAASQTNLASLESEVNYQKTNYQRQKNLHDKGYISDDALDLAYKAMIQAQRSVEQQRMSILAQQENVRKAETNLSYATITSPIDGVVLSKEVEEGQTVASSFNTPTLFTIAKDLTDMRVIAKVDEADIGNVKVGQRVEFTVDAFPDDVFNGNVTQVRQEATTESNVVTYEVVISAPNADLKLKPGLTANVTIFTSEKKGVMAIPNKALKFSPNEQMLAKDESIKDCNAKNKVWVKEGKTFKAIPVEIGLSNGSMTELISGISKDQQFITEFEMAGGEEEANNGNNNPFMPKFKDKNKKSSSESGSSSGGSSGGNAPKGGAPSGGGSPH